MVDPTNLHSGDKNGCEGHFLQIDIDNKDSRNGHAVSSGDQTGFGARARARHASREEGKDKKKNCLLCRPDKDGLVGPSFLGFSGYHKKPQKRKKHFLQGPPPFPLPNLSTTRPSCAQHLATACLFRLLGTNIKFKDGATQVLSPMFLYFPTSRFVAIIFML